MRCEDTVVQLVGSLGVLFRPYTLGWLINKSTRWCPLPDEVMIIHLLSYDCNPAILVVRTSFNGPEVLTLSREGNVTLSTERSYGSCDDDKSRLFMFIAPRLN